MTNGDQFCTGGSTCEREQECNDGRNAFRVDREWNGSASSKPNMSAISFLRNDVGNSYSKSAFGTLDKNHI
jgi:hypothetical protein